MVRLAVSMENVIQGSIRVYFAGIILHDLAKVIERFGLKYWVYGSWNLIGHIMIWWRSTKVLVELNIDDTREDVVVCVMSFSATTDNWVW